MARMVNLECAGLTALWIRSRVTGLVDDLETNPRRRQAGALQIGYAGPNPQLSELRRRDFIRCATVSVLRIEACDDRLRVVLRHAVHWQQALSSLRGRGGSGVTSRVVDFEMSALRNRHEVGHDRQRARARVRSVWRALA